MQTTIDPAGMTEGALFESFHAVAHVAGEPRYEALRREIQRREHSGLVVGLSALALLGAIIGGISLL